MANAQHSIPQWCWNNTTGSPARLLPRLLDGDQLFD